MKVIAASNQTAFRAGLAFGVLMFGFYLAVLSGVKPLLALPPFLIVLLPLIWVFVTGQGIPGFVAPSHEPHFNERIAGWLRRGALAVLGGTLSAVTLAVVWGVLLRYSK